MKLMTNMRLMSKKCLVCGVTFGAGGRCLNRNCTQRFRRASAQYKAENKYVVSLHHSSTSLKGQAMTTLCGIIGVNAAQTHLLTGVDHKVVERIYTSLRSVVAARVGELQKLINLNDSKAWVDCEADEVTLCKKSVGGGQVVWTQYLGVIRRGCPETLILIKMRD
eukprot:1948445-Amphidinium_carterae.1